MFIDEIQEGLKTMFSKTENLLQTVNVTGIYRYGHKIQAPEIQIGLMNDTTVIRYETFSGETLRNMPLQLTIYSGQITVNGKTLPRDKSVDYIAELCRIWLEANKLKFPDIKSIRRISTSTTQPLGDIGASIYYKTMRYDIVAQPIII